MRAVVWVSVVLASTAMAASDGGIALKAAYPETTKCMALGSPTSPLPFASGETLEFDVDALGAKAGSMVMRVLPAKRAATEVRLPIEVEVATNTFFSKIRRVRGTATSTIDARTVRPLRYLEDATEDDQHRIADVSFAHQTHVARLVSTINGRTGSADLPWGNDISDVSSAVFLLRSLPLKAGQQLCFDVYGIRRIWRVWGTVSREHVSMPLGEFEAWHLAGQAARHDLPDQRREMHVWISDDARRLPLAALGTIDLGAVRATLTKVSRPGEKTARAENKANLTW